MEPPALSEPADARNPPVTSGATLPTKKVFTQKFAGMKRCRIASEVGTHSPWVSRLLKSMGHEVIVANARQVWLIRVVYNQADQLFRAEW